MMFWVLDDISLDYLKILFYICQGFIHVKICLMYKLFMAFIVKYGTLGKGKVGNNTIFSILLRFSMTMTKKEKHEVNVKDLMSLIWRFKKTRILYYLWS